jgi:streptogramin lyase
MTRARRILPWARSIAAIATFGLLTLHPKIGHAAPSGTLLSGTVRSASGERMEGVTVSAKVIGSTIATSVFTDRQGKYHFPPMQDGKYWVWAQAVAFEAPRVDINLHHGVEHQDFVMSPTRNFFSQLSGDQLIAALPEDTPAHRRMKDIFVRNCVACHEGNVTLQNRYDAQGWAAIIWAMSRLGPSGGFSPAAQALPALVHFKADLAAYLAEMRGPGTSPMQLKVPPRPSGDSTLPVIYAYDIPVDEGGGYILNNGSDWSLGPSMASGGGQGLHDAQVDWNGNLWVTSADAASPDRTITKIDGNTGEATKFKYPRPDGVLAEPTHGMTIAHDGTIWFNLLNTGQLGTIDPNTNKLEVFTPPAGVAPGPGISIEEDGHGFIWAATGRGSVRFDRMTKEFREFISLTPPQIAYGMTGDRDGNGWWTQFFSTNWCLGLESEIIGHSDIVTGKSLEVAVPPNTNTFLKPGDLTADDLKWYAPLGVGQVFPRRLGADREGDDVWAPDYLGQRLIRINTHTFQTTLYPMPRPNLNPYMAVVDKSHNVWIDLQGSDDFVKFDPKSSQFTFYSWPNRATATRGFHVLDRGGVVQVAGLFYNASAAAKVVFRSRQDVDDLEDANE